MTELTKDELFEKYGETELSFSHCYKNEFSFGGFVEIENKKIQISCCFCGSHEDIFNCEIDNVMTLDEIHKLITDNGFCYDVYFF